MHLLAVSVSGRSRDRSGYGRQRQFGVELADGGAESQEGQMLLAAFSRLSSGVHGPHCAAWPCSQTVLLLDEQSK